MGISSGVWYTSGTFWAIAGVAAVLVIGIISAGVGWLAVNPTRSLFYDMPVITPLLNAGDIQGLKVFRNDDLITTPQVLEVVLSSQGRLDISSGSFDDGVPLRLDVGVTILEILKVTSAPKDHGNPRVDTDGSVLAVGPSLIGRRQKTSFSLLVDGPNPVLTCPNSPLVDVKVLKGTAPPVRASAWVQVPLKVAALPLLVIIALWARNAVGETPSTPLWTLFAEVFAAGAAAWMAMSLIVWALTIGIDKLGLGSSNSSFMRWKDRSRSFVPLSAALITLAILAFNPGYQPYFGTRLGSYYVTFPVGSSVPFRPDGFVPSLHSGIVTFSNGRIISKSMILGVTTTRPPNFDHCAALLFLTKGGHNISLPRPGDSICASGFNVITAMRVVSVNDRRVTLYVTVWAT